MSDSRHDDFSRQPVGGGHLRPWWYLLTIELGVLISIPLFVIGGQLGLGLSLTDLVLSAFCGGIILGAIGGPTARLGAKTRCSTALIARATFGSLGAACIGLLLSLAMTGWWAVQTELFSDAVIKLSRALFQWSIPREVMVLVGGCLMITTAALGIRAIGRLAYLAVPLLAAGLVYALSTLFLSGQWQLVLDYQPPAGMAIGLGPAIATVVGGWIVGASMNPDFARFARNTRHAVGYALGHYSFNYPLMLTLCGIMAIGFGTRDLLVHLVPNELAWLLLVLIMLATWAANDCNLYSSSLGLTAIFPRLNRSSLAIAAGTIGILLAELHLSEHMVSFLVLLGILIAPVSGIFIVSAVDPREPGSPDRLAPVPRWRAAQLLSWSGGALVGFITSPKQALGPGLITLTTVPALDAVMSAAAFMALMKLFSRLSAVRADPSLATSVAETEN